MSVGTAIEWTDATWNVLRGCTRVSAGCVNCYAEKVAHRFNGPGLPYEGLTNAQGRWNGTIRVVDDKLTEPLTWKKPRRVFVNSMSDLFHENVSDETIDRIFAVMALADQHTFQVLTKRPERMRAYMGHPEREALWMDAAAVLLGENDALCDRSYAILGQREPWLPLPNVWLGVSVENQATADARIPILLRTPAAVRFISAEPLVGAVSLSTFLPAGDSDNPTRALNTHGQTGTCLEHGSQLSSGKGHAGVSPQATGQRDQGAERPAGRKLDWVIIGGESGPGARPCWTPWVRRLVEQCAAAPVACFVKQLGADVRDRNDAGFMGDEADHWPEEIAFEDRIEHDLDGTRDGYQGAPVRIHLKDRKGANIAEWPEDLRVRQFPSVVPV